MSFVKRFKSSRSLFASKKPTNSNSNSNSNSSHSIASISNISSSSNSSSNQFDSPLSVDVLHNNNNNNSNNHYATPTNNKISKGVVHSSSAFQLGANSRASAASTIRNSTSNSGGGGVSGTLLSTKSASISSSSSASVELSTRRLIVYHIDSETEGNFSLTVKNGDDGAHVLDMVCSYYSLLDYKEYFGLKYTLVDEHGDHEIFWLDANKPIGRQLKDTNNVLTFRVKHFPGKPQLIESEYVRYLIYLQIRNYFLKGDLQLAPSEEHRLAAYAIQASIGDYDPDIHRDYYYLTELRFLSRKALIAQDAIIAIHKQLKGKTPADMELAFLERASQFDTYGAELLVVKNSKGVAINFGVSHNGIITYLYGQASDAPKIGLYPWTQVGVISYEGRTLKVHAHTADPVNPEIINKQVMVFKCNSQRICKHLWKFVLDQKAFFNFKRGADVPNIKSSSRLFTRKSKFRYSGRCESELIMQQQQQQQQQQEAQGSFTNVSPLSNNTTIGSDTDSSAGGDHTLTLAIARPTANSNFIRRTFLSKQRRNTLISMHQAQQQQSPIVASGMHVQEDVGQPRQDTNNNINSSSLNKNGSLLLMERRRRQRFSTIGDDDEYDYDDGDAGSGRGGGGGDKQKKKNNNNDNANDDDNTSMASQATTKAATTASDAQQQQQQQARSHARGASNADCVDCGGNDSSTTGRCSFSSVNATDESTTTTAITTSQHQQQQQQQQQEKKATPDDEDIFYDHDDYNMTTSNNVASSTSATTGHLDAGDEEEADETDETDANDDDESDGAELDKHAPKKKRKPTSWRTFWILFLLLLLLAVVVFYATLGGVDHRVLLQPARCCWRWPTWSSAVSSDDRPAPAPAPAENEMSFVIRAKRVSWRSSSGSSHTTTAWWCPWSCDHTGDDAGAFAWSSTSSALIRDPLIYWFLSKYQ